MSLTYALMVALLGWVAGAATQGIPKLTGAFLDKVFTLVLDTLDQNVTIEELAGAAETRARTTVESNIWTRYAVSLRSANN